jgi:hypothetical protein
MPVTQSFTVAPNLIVNGTFENGTLSSWQLLVAGGEASAGPDTSTAIGGQFSALINVGQTSPNSQIDFQSGTFPLAAGKQYQLNFWAMSDAAPPVTVVAQGGTSLSPDYGLSTPLLLTSGTWSYYSMTFVASATANDATLGFWLGAQSSKIWIDNVQLFATGN